MEEFLEKFISIKRDVVGEKGPFALFGLFERESLPNRWDVVISAPWVDEYSVEDYGYFADKINSKLTTPQEVVQLSRIVLLNPTECFVKDVIKRFGSVNDGIKESANENFCGISIRRAYVIASDPVAALRAGSVANV
jgi:hypothetical protein